MKLAWLIALVLMLIGFAVLFRPPRIDEKMAPASPSVAAVSEDLPKPAEISRVDAPISSVERSAIASVARAIQGPRTQVTGRCVDESAHPLPDVELTLEPVGERWSASVPGAFAIVDGRPQFQLHARSGSDGRFHFDAPSPDTSSILLVATPDPARLVLSRKLDHVIGRTDVDLGDFVFESAGRIEGRVHTSSDEPVAGVLVHARLESESAECPTDRDGRFLLGHLVGGGWMVEVRSQCFAFERERPVDVVAGGDPVELDLIARPVPVLEGRVVDPDGAPIATAELQAHRQILHEYGVDSTHTEADGTFKLCLRSEIRAPFNLSAFHVGFVPTDVPLSVVADRHDLVVVMQRSPRMTFRVVDADTGIPVLRYRIQVVSPPSSQSMSFWIDDEYHPQGEAELDIDHEDALVLVAAENRAHVQASVAPDDPGGHVQTLRLSPGASIFGRATVAGGPSAGIEVHARFSRPPSEPTPARNPQRLDELARTRGAAHAPPVYWPEEDRSMTTEADGRFRFDALPEGNWSLVLRGIGIASRVLAPNHIATGSSFDVGDVRLDSGSSIEGRVLLPDGVDPQYVRVMLDRNSLYVNADEHGTFRFAGLEPGLHRVEVPLDTKLGISGLWSDVEVGADEQHHLDIDLRESALARVHVRVTLDGAPLMAASASIESSPSQRIGSTARTDHSGDADLCAPARVPVRIAVSFFDRVLARSNELTLAPGEHAELEIKLDLGRLEVRLPERIQSSGVLTVIVDQGGHPQTIRIPAGPAFGQAQPEWNSSHVTVGPIAAGTYSIVVFQRDDEMQTDSFRFEGSVTVESHRTSVVDFSGK